MVLLDTNVLSELVRPAPAKQVERWLAGRPSASVFISAITEAELRYGAALLPEGRRRTSFTAAIAALLEIDFAGRILPFDSAAAIAFADIAAARRAAGRPISHPDAQIAAIARSRGAALATRNAPDFDLCGLAIINPWRSDTNPYAA